MSNQITAAIPPAELAQALDLLKQARAILAPYLYALTPEERKSLVKMGNKSVGFMTKLLDYAANTPAFVTGFISYQERVFRAACTANTERCLPHGAPATQSTPHDARTARSRRCDPSHLRDRAVRASSGGSWFGYRSRGRREGSRLDIVLTPPSGCGSRAGRQPVPAPGRGPAPGPAMVLGQCLPFPSSSRAARTPLCPPRR